MEARQPSRTAFAAAAHRAAHQILEGGGIFSDPLAVRILGQDADAIARQEEHPSRRRMRLFIAVRTRFAEDALLRAVESGVRQIVILGAGLDTYAYRTSVPNSRVRIFEVDHPATQEWKRRRLKDAGIAVPDMLTFAAVDFERETLADGLHAAGFNLSLQAFFTWLGVVPYLSENAVWSTLQYIAEIPGGAHVVFDYANPPTSLDSDLRASHDERAARVAAIGEPWVSYFEEETLHTELMRIGFTEIEDLGPREIAERYFPDRAAPAREKGGHIIRAVKSPAAPS